MKYDLWQSPWGELLLAVSDKGVTQVTYQQGDHPVSIPDTWERDIDAVSELKRQLQEYYEGKRQQFTLPLDPQGTEFQCQVWQALAVIPYGESRSYADIAHDIGRPKSMRAVGAANGRNPIAIIVPCHRVIGKDGSLTGYAGGLEVKQQLLRHERIM